MNRISIGLLIAAAVLALAVPVPATTATVDIAEPLLLSCQGSLDECSGELTLNLADETIFRLVHEGDGSTFADIQ